MENVYIYNTKLQKMHGKEYAQMQTFATIIGCYSFSFYTLCNAKNTHSDMF
jgi:hypothetical protein